MNTERLLVERNDSRLPAGEASGSPCHEGAFHLKHNGRRASRQFGTVEKAKKSHELIALT